MQARQQTSFLFDLDGTLVDSVYDHVLAWHDALLEEGYDISVWRLHRRIGMSGSLFTKALAREAGHEFDADTLGRLRVAHVGHEPVRRERERQALRQHVLLQRRHGREHAGGRHLLPVLAVQRVLDRRGDQRAHRPHPHPPQAATAG